MYLAQRRGQYCVALLRGEQVDIAQRLHRGCTILRATLCLKNDDYIDYIQWLDRIHVWLQAVVVTIKAQHEQNLDELLKPVKLLCGVPPNRLFSQDTNLISRSQVGQGVHVSWRLSNGMRLNCAKTALKSHDIARYCTILHNIAFVAKYHENCVLHCTQDTFTPSVKPCGWGKTLTCS